MHETTHTLPGYETTILPLRDALYARAHALTRDSAAADDLTQDVLIRAYNSWHTFTPGTNARAWLFTILRHTFYTQCKAHVRRSQVHKAAGCEQEAPLDVESTVVAHETAQRVREALTQLPEVYRAAVEMADLEGYSYRETAEALDCPIGSVMSRLYRGRRKLAELLGSE